MDRRSWLWRRKSSEKSPGETESSGGSISSHSERFSDDQVYSNQNSQSTEVVPKAEPPQSEHNQTLSEKLAEALVSIKAKEELVKQHVKVAEEAVSGWEKAEQEVLAMRQQVEVLNVRNSTLEDRVVHLDGALKECLRQLRQTREEKDQLTHEALEKRNSETESCLTSIDADLYHKLETAEKENSDLRHEISSMAEELEIRLIEKELSNQAAEQASKQHLDSLKKVAKLEAECHRLNSALQKANNHQPNAHKRKQIIEDGGLKETSRLGRNQTDSIVEIDLMNDFLEMERLVGLPESSKVDERLKKVESLEIILKERENELKASRNQVEEAEYKLAEHENELRESRNQIEEVEYKLAEHEIKLKASRSRLEETESKLAECENELKASRNRLEEAESKLAEREKELTASRNHLKETESKLAAQENELKASRNRVKESEFKLAERENELKSSRDHLEEAEHKLAEHENELQASRYQLEKAESKLAGHEIELQASRFLLEKAESKLAKTTSGLEMTEAELKATKMKKEEAESRCNTLEPELEMLLLKVDSLENDLQKERDLSVKTEVKYQEVLKSGTRAKELQLLRVNQDKELSMAGSKFADCQKTIASLNRQLRALATFNDLLIDANDF